MSFRYIFVLILTASCSYSSLVTAADRWFDIELLVFKRNVDVNDINEQLDQNNVYLKQRDRQEVFKAKQVTECFADKPCLHQKNPVEITNNEIVIGSHRIQRLDSSHLQLLKQREKLNKHELFNPIMHVALRMPLQNKQNALPIHLFAGENYALAKHGQTQLNQKEESTQQPLNIIEKLPEQANTVDTEKLDVLAALQKQDTIQDLYEIDGDFLIYVERYLFIDSQLIVRTETEKEISPMHSVLANIEEDEVIVTEVDTPSVEVVAQESIVQKEVETETVITETLFDQNRRLRSEEIHYLDHPLFGIIVQIRKIPEEQLPQ